MLTRIARLLCILACLGLALPACSPQVDVAPVSDAETAPPAPPAAAATAAPAAETPAPAEAPAEEAEAAEPPMPKGFDTPQAALVAVAGGQVEKIDIPEVPESVTETKDVEYCNVNGKSLQLDLFQPKNLDKPAPAIVVIHGGAWAGGDRSMYRAYAIPLAEHGYVTATVSYRLTGEATFPAAVQDVKCAVKFLRANAQKYNIDPDRIGVTGGSAGGHLAMMVAYAPDTPELEPEQHQEVSDKVQAVVDIYGPTDLTVESARAEGAVTGFLGKSYDEAPDLFRLASPLAHLDAGDPPTLIIHGTIDDTVRIEHAEALAAKLKELGIPFGYEKFVGWPHAMDMANDVYKRSLWAQTKFFDQYLKSAADQPAAAPVAEAGEPPIPSTPYKSSAELMTAIATGKIKMIEREPALPESVVETKDIEYCNVDGKSLQLDLYAPKGLDHPVPGLIFIHGGGWTGGHRHDYYPYLVEFAKRGYVATSMTYRFANEAEWPAQVKDVKCAIKFLRANAQKYNIDPDRIAVLGGSAGGHLSMMAGYTSGAPEFQAGPEGVSDKVQAVVDLYGPTDLTVDIARNHGGLRMLMGGRSMDEVPDLYKQISPINWVTPDDPPTLIFQGTLDDTVPADQSDLLAAKLKELGVAHEYEKYEGWPHTMDLAQDVYNRTTFVIDRFLKKHLGGPVPAGA